MRAVLLSLLVVVPGFAQVALEVSSTGVLLNNTEARSIKVSAPKGGILAYTVADKPAWLATSSSNNYTTPDTLYFQLASSTCGTCSATLRLAPVDGGQAIAVTVRFAPESQTTLTGLAVSPTAVNLNSTQARSILVSAPRGASLPYTVKNAPPWLTVTSANKYTTPDTLYFQLANASCGTCTANLELLAAGSSSPTIVPVTTGISAGSSYRATPSRLTLTYPAGAGTTCGPGYMSRCTVGVNSNVASVKAYSAKINPGAGDKWLLINDRPGVVDGVPLANGLTLSVNPNAARSLETGAYSGQVVVYNPANQADLILIDVSLLVNPGKVTISPDSGSGSNQTFTLEFPHPGGWQNLSVLNVLINNGLELARGCYLAYEVPIGMLHLTDDQGNVQGPAGEIPLGKSGKNSQCGVRLTSVKGEGNLLTLTLDVTFNPAFAGKKTIYLAARDKEQGNSGWLVAGTWEIRPPAPVRKKSTPVKK